MTPDDPATPPAAAPPARTLFLLSPANCGGRRAQILRSERAAFPLAVQLREAGAPLGEVFSFLSGLYFRGKLAYGMAFGSAATRPGALVITPGRGLVPADTIVRMDDLEEIASIGVSQDEPRFREPLERDAAALAATLDAGDRVVLLGSIATGKYVDVIERLLDGRLFFPAAFVGRGDMSRGGLMLRCVLRGEELEYVPIAGAIRRGPRPPRLEPIR
ncbi:MAG TPA: hypothetical protein VFM00_13180 [Candidatus Eisenbacteria bacterium]|nr:hypothetical protein [Candidatus Eisenbacteria bacterium]